MNHDATLAHAAALIEAADGLLICAGAGMGIDSGLPDFRGAQGFWHAYPALGAADMRFEAIANPSAFRDDPELAWGFYGHRLALYRATQPHVGFAILRRWAQKMQHGSFVFTSNVDGQFQRAGFAEEQIAECHGSLHWLQCIEPCNRAIWPAQDFIPQVDTERCRLIGPMPACPYCGGLARPNVLMFDDWYWLAQRSGAQQRRLALWREQVEHLVVLELGAGTRIPTVRHLAHAAGGDLMRINPDAAHAGNARINLSLGAREALQAIDALL
ncbi:MAG: NAD-dependent deacetylase [Betaproteobacteria bacterium]|nr:NAD-dependent deacetylase [Betaproteobacteria bacterium]